MRLFSPLLFIGSAVFAGLMHRADAALQKHRVPTAPESAYKLVPIRWFDPALYTSQGEQYRLAAIRALQVMIICFMAGMLVFGLGL